MVKVWYSTLRDQHGEETPCYVQSLFEFKEAFREGLVFEVTRLDQRGTFFVNTKHVVEFGTLKEDEK